jgi:hypothetical protein
MTHDELLARIAKLSITPETNVVPSQLATGLMAVVELHKPDKEGFCAMNCVEVDDDGCAWTQVVYPCPTIQVIEKELA